MSVSIMRKSVLSVLALGAIGCTAEPTYSTTDELLKRNNGFLPNGTMIPNEHGHCSTVSATGGVDLNNEFFQDLGANGRRCVSCHLPTAGWSVTPEQLQDTFDKSNGGVDDTDNFGLAAVFRLNDGANRPDADVSTLEARREAYSMLLTKGLIRVGIGVPTGAEFTLIAVDDPYGYASAKELSLFRRPLPSANLKFVSAVMWDGREVDPARPGIHFSLIQQANDATQGHAGAETPLTDAQRESIVAFEMSLAMAQESDNGAGNLSSNGATGGAKAIHSQDAYIGINDNLGDYRTRADFTPNVFTLYNAWSSSTKARQAIARGQQIFNTRQFTISGVAGLNGGTLCTGGSVSSGTPGTCVTLPSSFTGTCTTCHNTPNGGNHSTPVPLDIGLVAESERTPDMPLYTLACNAGPLAGKVFKVTDPGRALITGKCADIGKFKGPVLRGLASRAPYFHNGSAAALEDAVDFYDRRFNIRLSAQERADLAAFLATL
jgi:cytochrome c peroxidase